MRSNDVISKLPLRLPFGGDIETQPDRSWLIFIPLLRPIENVAAFQLGLKFFLAGEQEAVFERLALSRWSVIPA